MSQKVGSDFIVGVDENMHDKIESTEMTSLLGIASTTPAKGTSSTNTFCTEMIHSDSSSLFSIRKSKPSWCNIEWKRKWFALSQLLDSFLHLEGSLLRLFHLHQISICFNRRFYNFAPPKNLALLPKHSLLENSPSPQILKFSYLHLSSNIHTNTKRSAMSWMILKDQNGKFACQLAKCFEAFKADAEEMKRNRA